MRSGQVPYIAVKIIKNKQMKYLSLIVLSIILLANCNRKAITPHYSYEVIAIHSTKHADGTLYVRTSGLDKSKDLARDQALRNAIRAVMFKGIPNSSVKRPLISNPSAEQTFRDYFEAFFKEGGKYKMFIIETSVDEERRVGRKKQWRVFVRAKVYYTQLQKELEDARIIKKFGI